MCERGIQDVRMPFVPTLVVIIIRFLKDYIGWLAFRLPYSIPTSSCRKYTYKSADLMDGHGIIISHDDGIGKQIGKQVN